jgi:5-methylcytosine-specific restriction endonuclease McrA
MFYSCKYCGRIHEESFVCLRKPKKVYAKSNSVTEAAKIRVSSAWNTKRETIRKRDKYLCQLCLRNFEGTGYKYKSNELEVHHNIPLSENIDLKFESSNLITLCRLHHQMCDARKISRKEVQEIIDELEDFSSIKDFNS